MTCPALPWAQKARPPPELQYDNMTCPVLPWAQKASQQDIRLPSQAAERFVNSRRHVPGDDPKTHVQDQGTGHQRATIRRRQKSKASEDWKKKHKNTPNLFKNTRFIQRK